MTVNNNLILYRLPGHCMSGEESDSMGRIYIKVGSEEIDLTGELAEVSDGFSKILKTDTWQSALSKIRRSRDAAIEQATERAKMAGIPERGASFKQLLGACNVDRTSDVILASIHYLRNVERERDTPPREIRRLISQTGEWTEEEVEKWNLSLYINRMIEGEMLSYPPGSPKKNRFVVLTDGGLDHLEDLSM